MRQRQVVRSVGGSRELARPAHRDAVLQRVGGGLRRATQPRHVEQADILIHGAIEAHQHGLAFKARISPVFGPQPGAVRHRVIWRQDRGWHRWWPWQEVSGRDGIRSLRIYHPRRLSCALLDALQYAYTVRGLHEGAPTASDIVVGVGPDDRDGLEGIGRQREYMAGILEENDARLGNRARDGRMFVRQNRGPFCWLLKEATDDHGT